MPGRPTMIQNLRTLPAAVWILFAGTFVNRFGTFVMPFLVIYLTRQGFSAARAGLAVGAYGAGHLIASLLGGHLADRIGRRHTIALSMFSSAVAMVALSQARSFSAIVILASLAGVACELYRPASHALIGDLVTPEQRVSAFAMYRFAVNLGFAAGPATAGFLADRSFLLVFLGDAITSVGYGAIALLFLPHGLRGSSREEGFVHAVRSAMHDRRFLLFLAATATITVVDFQMGSTFALHVKSLGFPTSTYGLLISLNGVLIITLELLITAWTQHLRPQPIIALGYLLIGLGFALTGMAHTILALAGTVVLWSLGEMISSPLSGAYVTGMAPERFRGRYMGFFVLTFSIGMVIGPPVGTAIFQHNASALWLACGALGAISGALALLSGRVKATTLS